MADEQPTLFFSVPTSYAALAESLAQDAFASVRQGISAGEALPAEIFERYHHRIVNYLHGLVRDRELANDLAQDSFLKAYRALPRTGDDLRLAPWLYRIAGNTAFSALRRRRLIRWLPLLGDAIVVESADGHVAEAEAVERALARLPARYAAPLLLHSHEGRSCGEIAVILDISPGAVKTRLFRAREAFRAVYGEEAS